MTASPSARLPSVGQSRRILSDATRAIVRDVRLALPTWARKLLAVQRQRLVIDIVGDAGQAYLAVDTDVRREVSFDFDDAESHGTLRAMASMPLDEIVLRLASDVVLEKTLKLPIAARGDLAAILPFEVQRTVPLPADRMLFDFAVRPGRASLDVDVQVADRTAIVDAASRLADMGIVVDRVLGGAGTDRLADLDRFGSLLPPEHHPSRRSNGQNRLLLGLAMACLVLAIASPFASLALQRRSLEGAIAAAPVSAAGGVSVDDRARRVAGRKAGAPLVTVMLDDLTRLLPDDVWLNQFNWVDGQLEIEGTSRAAASLVARIEGSGRFAKVEFQTPVVRDPLTGGERFHFAILPKTVVSP